MSHRIGTPGAALGILAVVSLAWTAAPRAAEVRSYDALGRLTDVSYPNAGAFHYGYDANGNVLSVVVSTTGVAGDGVPPTFALGPITPNPGGGERLLRLALPSRGRVVL